MDSAAITQFLSALDISVSELEPLVKELSKKSFQDKINESSAQERIKISNGYAYILISLCFTYLKSQGVDTSKHPIMNDLNRIKSYMKKSTEKKEPAIDTAAAKRFIQAALNNNNREPAISSATFKGTHTKFDNKEESDDEKPIQKEDSKKKIKKESESRSKEIKEISKNVSKIVGDKLREQLEKKKKKQSKKSKDRVGK